MPSVTARQVISDAFGDLNVYQQGDTVGTADETDALRRLNLMIGQWAQQNLTIPAVEEKVFPLQAGKGGRTNPYTIGTGGDLNTPRPPNQNSLVGAALFLNASSPPVKLPRSVMTNNAFATNRIPDLTSALFTSVYYRPDFAGDLGSIFLWPVPTDLTNSLVLYIEAALSTFAEATTGFSVPPGYDDALHFNLATKLAIPYGRTITQDLKDAARDTLAVIKRSNLKLADLANDFAGIGGAARAGLYDIQTGARR